MPDATEISEDLPEPEGPTTATLSPASRLEADALEDVDRAGGGAQREMHLFQLKRGVRHIIFLRARPLLVRRDAPFSLRASTPGRADAVVAGSPARP